jgi:NAD(P)-dependent dehydrogenase (short-subunit alcohol dehydrogenase family)
MPQPMPLPRTPSFRLDGRRALVTGAGRGLGVAFAAALAEAGAHVLLAARSGEEIGALAAAIAEAGGSAEPLLLDVTDVAAVRRALDGRPPCDILVNNAGTNRPKPMIEVSEADYDAVAGLNLRAAFFVAQAVAARLVAAGRPGSIIHVTSQMGHVGAAGRTVYCTTKHGLEGLTKAMAVELAPHGIRVNAIAPTYFETPLTRPYFENAEFKRAVLSKIKLGRIGLPEDLMGAVLYLASDASAMVTGTSLKVDGGWTAE